MKTAKSIGIIVIGCVTSFIVNYVIALTGLTMLNMVNAEEEY